MVKTWYSVSSVHAINESCHVYTQDRCSAQYFSMKPSIENVLRKFPFFEHALSLLHKMSQVEKKFTQGPPVQDCLAVLPLGVRILQVTPFLKTGSGNKSAVTRVLPQKRRTQYWKLVSKWQRSTQTAVNAMGFPISTLTSAATKKRLNRSKTPTTRHDLAQRIRPDTKWPPKQIRQDENNKYD